MNITFEGEPLHETCIVLANAEHAYGSVAAAALVSFLEEARASETAEDLLVMLGDDLFLHADDSLSVAIGSDYRAALIVVGERHRTNADGRIVWESVTRLKMLEISRLP